jgi:hypothetical protein
MNLPNILIFLAAWAAVSLVASFGIGHVLGYCAQSDSPSVAREHFQEMSADSTFRKAA